MITDDTGQRALLYEGKAVVVGVSMLFELQNLIIIVVWVCHIGVVLPADEDVTRGLHRFSLVSGCLENDLLDIVIVGITVVGRHIK